MLAGLCQGQSGRQDRRLEGQPQAGVTALRHIAEAHREVCTDEHVMLLGSMGCGVGAVHLQAGLPWTSLLKVCHTASCTLH